MCTYIYIYRQLLAFSFAHLSRIAHHPPFLHRLLSATTLYYEISRQLPPPSRHPLALIRNTAILNVYVCIYMIYTYVAPLFFTPRAK